MSLIRIIIPAYNNPECLRETLASVKNQTFPHYTVVVVDDCSPTNLREHIEDYLLDERFEYVRNTTNSGGMRSFDEQLDNTCHEYVMLLMHDDLLNVNFLQRLVLEGLEEQKHASFACSLYCVSIDGKVLNYSEHLIPDYKTGVYNLSWHIIFSNWILFSFCIFRTSALQKSSAVKRWISRNRNRPSLNGNVSAGDWYVLAQMSTHHKALYVADRLGIYVRHSRGRTESQGDFKLDEVSFVLDHIYDDVNVFSTEERIFAKCVSVGRIFSSRSVLSSVAEFLTTSSYSRNKFRPSWLDKRFAETLSGKSLSVLSDFKRDSTLGRGEYLLTTQERDLYAQKFTSIIEKWE